MYLVGNPKERFACDAVEQMVPGKTFATQKADNTCTVMILSFRIYRSGQTVQTKIRLLLEEQSDQGLYCLLFHLHRFDKIP